MRLLKIIIFSVFLIFSTFRIVTANGPHLYQVAHVNLVMKNGEQKNGYIPIYGGYIDWRIEDNSLVAADLMEILKEGVEKVIFVETYYNFPGIGSMVAAEDIDTLSLSEIGKIIFISWEKSFGGAFELPNIPQESISKLQTREVIEIRVEGDVMTAYVFVNLNPQISHDELDLVTKYFANLNQDLFYWFPPGIFKGNDSIYIEQIKEIIQKKSKCLINERDSITFYCENESIGNLMKFIRNEYEKRMKLNDAILLFIDGCDKSKLLKCIEEEVKNEKLKNKMLSTMKEFTVEQGVAPILREIAWSMNEFLKLNYREYASSYKLLISKNDVILIIYRSD